MMIEIRKPDATLQKLLPPVSPRRACGEMRNIVTGLRMTGKLKLFGKRPV